MYHSVIVYVCRVGGESASESEGEGEGERERESESESDCGCESECESGCLSFVCVPAGNRKSWIIVERRDSRPKRYVSGSRHHDSEEICKHKYSEHVG